MVIKNDKIVSKNKIDVANKKIFKGSNKIDNLISNKKVEAPSLI